jgi:hypothetical protein
MDAKTKGAGHCGGDQAPKNDRLGSAINSKTNLARSQTQAVVCATCGRRTIRKARQQRYCSTRCREQGKERSRKAFVGGDTGAPPNPPKKENKNNVLQGGKSGSSFPINLLGGGSWQARGQDAAERCWLSANDCKGWRGCQVHLPNPLAHAAARLRLQARQ